MSAARRQLQLLANPFLNNGAEPKIPDGMCSSSMGIRQQAATEFTQYDEYLDIVFWPGLASGCMVIGQTGGADGKGVRADMEYTGTTICEVPVDEFGTKLVFQKFNKVSRWRIVSQGAKISLTNNADDNDGWFEAIRFVPPNDEGKMYLVNNILDPGTNLADNCHLGPDQSIWDLHGNTSLVSHPSFITGKLRDIHRYNWNLHHFENSFDFTNCQHKYTLSLATDKTAIPAGKALDANGFKYRAFDENEANADFVNSFIDRKMDAILVRIHGKGKKNILPANTFATPTKVLIHVVANQEVIHFPGETLAKYQTASVTAGTALPQVTRAQNKDTAAGTTATAQVRATRNPNQRIRNPKMLKRYTDGNKRPSKAQRRIFGDTYKYST